jgi:hypothetical protein
MSGESPVILCSRVLRFILVPSLLAVQACAVAERKEAFSGGSRSASGFDVTGLWEGTAVNGCGFVQMERTRCHAVVNIALTMTQQGSMVGGSYKCSMGTMMCRKLNDTGRQFLKAITPLRLICVSRVRPARSSSTRRRSKQQS